MATTDAPAPAGHIDLVLQQIESLPTLSQVAVRVMTISEAEHADLREIARVVESDPALSVRMLALCRRADKGVGNRITTVERAVVMLGLDAVRASLLSVEVYEAFQSPRQPGASGESAPRAGLDRRELWRHCLAVACACELLAERIGPALGKYRPQEAFLAGMLHDLGKLALDRILPRAYARVVELVDQRGADIAEVERRVLGIDHHTAGKRLAEYWRLPHSLQDVLWLHNQPASLLPDVPHRPLIALVTVADALVRRLHLGWSGGEARGVDVEARFREFGFEPRLIPIVEREIHQQVAARSADLGLSEPDGPGVLLECIRRANSKLGLLSAQLAARASSSAAHARALAGVADFHDSPAPDSPRSLPEAMGSVVRSASGALGAGFYAAVVQSRAGAPWSVLRLDAQGRGSPHWVLDQPPGNRDLRELCDPASASLDQGPLLGWLAEQIQTAAGERGAAGAPADRVLLLPLIAGGGLNGLLLHDRAEAAATLTDQGLRALARVWGSALASAAQHEGARRMGEQLADANRQINAAQSELVESRSLARLGELAAGAAHEMNNPLAVISGHSQILAKATRNPESRTAVNAIIEASEKLSELISSLHLFAAPPRLERQSADLLDLLQQAATLARRRAGLADDLKQVRVSIDQGIPHIRADPHLLTLALTELILNALQSAPKQIVEVHAHLDPFDGRLMISVSDDGVGMSEHALRHAFDPFFSELPAGRRSGLGLTRARRFIELHGGDVALESRPGKGCCARVTLTHWRAHTEDESDGHRRGSEAA